MITGWLSGEDCPDCGGPLLDISTGPRLLVLACPGCGYSITWQATDPDDITDPDHMPPAQRLLHVLADRQRWHTALALARARASGQTASPELSATGRAA